MSSTLDRRQFDQAFKTLAYNEAVVTKRKDVFNPPVEQQFPFLFPYGANTATIVLQPRWGKEGYMLF